MSQFPPPVVDVRSLEQIVGEDPLQGCRKPLPATPKAPSRGRFGKWALVGTVAGVCLGLVVKVGVFAYAAPQSQPIVAGIVEDPAPISVEPSRDLPEVPTVLVDEVVIVAKAPTRISKAPVKVANDTPECHRENGVRVCRPNAVAASPIVRRSASLLAESYR